MQLIRADLLPEVLRGVSCCEEWPYVSSFTYVGGSVDMVCLGSMERYWHLSLYDFIKGAVGEQLQRELDTYDREIVMGSIQWESPTDLTIRTTEGHSLGLELDSALRRIVEETTR